MTNAKSRLVRIIALALAVLMIVPMALVGCKKTNDTGVDQAAIDAAIKEALDAAQKAQDAADKAAQDAQAAQDKLAASEKEAADLQAQIDAMKNTTTTAAPATTTKAPVSEDQKIVDSYIASVILDAKSEFSKIVATYNAIIGIYFGADSMTADAAKVDELIKTAKIAIQRAPSTDYVNSIVAQLVADLDAVPTFSERVKEAYDAIDFASDVDVIDVVYAANLADAAAKIKTDITLSKEAKDAELKEADLEEILKAEVDALYAFGADELDLATAINQEYYRYTGKQDKVKGAEAIKSAEVLYADVFNAAGTTIVDKIVDIYGSTLVAGDELKVEDIVYDPAVSVDDAKAIEKLYTEFYNVFKREDYASLKEDFEIAFVGEAYILNVEGNYLQEKLAVAKERLAELDAAAKEYNKASFSGKLTEIIDGPNGNDGYLAKQKDYDYTNKKNVDKVSALLDAWMEKYSFSKDDKNLGAIIGDADYKAFLEAKEYVDFVSEWALKLENIGKKAIEELVDEYDDNNDASLANSRFDYKKYSAVASALETWLKGSWDEKKLDYSDNGINKAKFASTVIFEADDPATTEDESKINVTYTGVGANVGYILDEVLGYDATEAAALTSIINYFRSTIINNVVAKADKINKAMTKIELEGLTIDSKEINKIASLMKDVYGDATSTGYLDYIGCEYEEDEDHPGDPKYYKWDLESPNANLINWSAYNEILAAYNVATSANVVHAEEIVKAYISMFGTVTEDGIKHDGRLFEMDHQDITIYSYELIKSLKAIYDKIQVGNTAALTNSIVILDAEGEEYKDLTFADAIPMYREISNQFYYTIMNEGHKIVYGDGNYDYHNTSGKAKYTGLIQSSVVNGGTSASANDWRASFAKNATFDYDATETTKVVGLKSVYDTAYGYDLFEKVEEIRAIFGDKADELLPEFRFVGSVSDTEDINKNGDIAEGLPAGSAPDVINIYATPVVLKNSSTKLQYSYADAVFAVDVYKFITKSSEGAITGFDKAGYSKEITAKTQEYYEKWSELYIKSSTVANEKIVNNARNLADYVLNFGLWTIEDTFEVDEEVYTFKIDTNGTVAEIKLYAEDGEEITWFRDKDDTNAYHFYTIDLALNNIVNKANVQIIVKEIKGQTDNRKPELDPTTKAFIPVMTTDATPVQVVKTLAEVDDTEVETVDYIYDMVDYKDAIIANIKKLPSSIKKVDHATHTYSLLKDSHFTKILDAYLAREFYNDYDVEWAKLKDALKVSSFDSNGNATLVAGVISGAQSEIKRVAKEYYAQFANAVYGGSVTIDALKGAVKTATAEVAAIIADATPVVTTTAASTPAPTPTPAP